MECTVRWGGPSGMTFMAETGSGHLVGMDGAADGGGRNLAARPMELVLAGTGGCTAYDVVLILKRGRHDVRGCDELAAVEQLVELVENEQAAVINRDETQFCAGPLGQQLPGHQIGMVL